MQIELDAAAFKGPVGTVAGGGGGGGDAGAYEW